MSRTVAGQILTPEGWICGRLDCTAQIRGLEPDTHAPVDRFVLPGFVDLHVHGGGGADAMEGPDGIRRMAAFHARHGTTALLVTTVTAPQAELLAAASAVGEVMAEPATARAHILGLHLEGPFINPEMLGAQPPFAMAPDLPLIEELSGRAPLRVVTYAPEIDPEGQLLADLARRGVRAQIGHTACSYAQAKAALAAGASGFTHLFNAMSGLHHRAPGAAGAALAHAEWAELIPDLLHVEDGAVLAALRSIPRLYCITDAVAAAGMDDGAYRLGDHRILKNGTSVRLADGTLAGSILTMDLALRNLLALGLSLEEASRRCATLPADYLGLAERGRLEVGAAADLVVVDRHGRLLEVYAEGSPVVPGP